jgi:hypothetical protein
VKQKVFISWKLAPIANDMPLPPNSTSPCTTAVRLLSRDETTPAWPSASPAALLSR